MCAKNFQIFGVHIPRRYFERRHFYSCPSSFKTGCSFLTLGRRKLLIPLGSIFSKICSPQQQRGIEETIICFIKIQSEKMKMIWNIRLVLGMINIEMLVQFIIF